MKPFYYAIAFKWPNSNGLGFYALPPSGGQIRFGTKKDAKADLKYVKGRKPEKIYFIVKLKVKNYEKEKPQPSS